MKENKETEEKTTEEKKLKKSTTKTNETKKIEKNLVGSTSTEKGDDKEALALLNLYVKPHDKVSVDVEEKDIEKVIEDATKMFKMCFLVFGNKYGAKAIAHMQINDKKPLRFFVLAGGAVVINPVIKNHTKVHIDSEEGCMSFPFGPDVTVPRYNKIDIEYRLLMDGKISDKVTQTLNGEESKIFQHEIDHFGCKTIYDRAEMKVDKEWYNIKRVK